MAPRRNKNIKTPASERVWKKVMKLGLEDCWLWEGFRTKKGYGRLASSKSSVFAHRAAYESAVGPIPPGLCVLHHCDNPACCNPAHLWLGTIVENNRDKLLKGRNTRKLTDQNVLDIRAEPLAKAHDLAARFGVCVTTINYIRRGEAWRHLLPGGDLIA